MVANRLTFKATLAQVSVPATSANLGPGFDTFGIALDLRDRYAAQVLDEAIFDVDVSGEGAEDVKKDKNNLVIKSMLRGFDFMGQKPRGIALRALNVTPHSRGLGSSASAIVGGLTLARDLVLGGEQYMSGEELMALATELEGHPDNVAAAIHGGATIAWMEEIYGVKTGRSVSIPVGTDEAWDSDQIYAASRHGRLSERGRGAPLPRAARQYLRFRSQHPLHASVGASRRDQAEAAGAHPYERRHAGPARYAGLHGSERRDGCGAVSSFQDGGFILRDAAKAPPLRMRSSRPSW